VSGLRQGTAQCLTPSRAHEDRVPLRPACCKTSLHAQCIRATWPAKGLRAWVLKARPKGKGTASKRDTIAAVRTEFDARLSRMEGALGDVIAAGSKTHEAVNSLSARVSDRMAA
jgi:hypothetical protein